MSTITSKRLVARKRLAISFVVLATLIILLGLLAYFWLPGFAKSRIEAILSDTLHRPVTIQSIDFHLYSLELTVHEFRVGEKSSRADADETFFSFEKLYVDLGFIESVTHRAPVVSAITLQTPTLRLVRDGENQFNISDLVTEFSQPSDDDDDAETETKFSVSNIVIEGGYFELIDQFKQSHQKISDFDLGIPFVANFESKQTSWVEPYLSAMVNGSPFLLDGMARPFADKREATLELKLKDIDLTSIDEYSPIPTGIHLVSGYFDSDLQITFSQIVDEAPAIVISGETALKQLIVHNRAVATPYRVALGALNVRLNDIDLTGQKTSNAVVALSNFALIRDGETEAVLSLPKLAISDIEIDITQQQIIFDEIWLDRFNASVRREIEGDIDLLRLFEENPQYFEENPQYTAPLPTSSRTKETIPVSAGAVPEENKSFPLPAHKPPVPEIKQVVIPTPDKKPHVAAKPAKASPDEAVADSSADVDSSQKEEISEQSWTAQIKRLKITAASFRFEDAALPDLPPMVIDPFNLTLTDIDSSGEEPVDLVLQATVNQRGSIDTEGSLSWAPLAADLSIDLKDVDLVALQGWGSDKLNAVLTRGAASFLGNVKAEGEPLKVSVTGQGRLSDFNLFDKITGADLAHWQNLDIDGIDIVSEPLQVEIDEITLNNFFARVTLLPEGRLNVGLLVRGDEKATSPSPSPPAAATTDRPSQEKALPVRIGNIILQKGDVNFNDRFIRPNYRAKLTGLNGEIGPINPGKQVNVDIRGAVDRSAPLKIGGKFDPFGNEMQLDINASAKGIDMPSFSPYSGNYVGQLIEKGKLSVDIHYHIEAGVLTAENNIFLDQLTLGEKTDNPDALSLPLGLAISLLKNRHGEIDLHLPVEGSLDDPQFSIGGIIFDAFVNLIMRAVTAPFALLGSVLEGGEELSEIEFSAGQASIEAEAETRLQTLSEALIDRPALDLEITGYADPVKDSEGLKQVILDRQIKALKLTEDAKEGKGGGSLDEVTLEPEEYEEYLTVIYEESDFEKPTNFLGLTKSLPVPEMEQAILAHTEVSDDQMQTLAEQRAENARNWLINQGGVASERVFVLGAQTETETDEPAHGSRVEFSLK
ncbi:MAG: hypothetical protein NMNS01_21470 [Nitrosomonas sp.]|nr:MAG: hypothetical protein NMNS01_21470 [Nitrosomonas sp.]